MTAPLERLALALADRYRVGRELGQGGTRLKSRLGNAVAAWAPRRDTTPCRAAA